MNNIKFDKFIKIKILEIIIGIISLIVCLKNDIPDTYSNLFWIPLTYIIVVLIFKSRRLMEFKNFAIAIVDVITAIKYCIMPFFIVINKDFYNGILTAQIPSKYYIDQAIVLTIIEMLAVYLFLFLYACLKKKNIKENEINTNYKISIPIVGFCIIGCLVAIKYNKNFLPNQIFFVDSSYEKNTIESNLDGLITIILNCFKIFIFLISLQYCINRYKEKKSNKYIFYSVIVLLIYIALNSGLSRWSIIIPTIVSSNLFIKLFGKKAKKYIGFIIAFISVCIISMTIVKFNWVLDEDSSTIQVFKIYTQQLQEYFSGVRAVAQGVETVDIYRKQIDFQTFFNDFTGSIPFISHWINQDNRINIYYNYLLKGTKKTATQIMPMMSIGYAYFGTILSWILIVLHIWFAIKLAETSKKATNIYEKYIFLIISFWYSMSLGFNTQIIFAMFISLFVPFVAIIKLNNYFANKNKFIINKKEMEN